MGTDFSTVSFAFIESPPYLSTISQVTKSRYMDKVMSPRSKATNSMRIPRYPHLQWFLPNPKSRVDISSVFQLTSGYCWCLRCACPAVDFLRSTSSSVSRTKGYSPRLPPTHPSLISCLVPRCSDLRSILKNPLATWT